MRLELDNNSVIEAADIRRGENVKFGKNINIKVRGVFSIGDNSYIGDRFQANAEELTIGKYFYNAPTDSKGMIIGGGGSNFPFASLKIGDRCVCHTGHINLARSIEIGNDVGLSHGVELITHGFWGSILEGYPATFSGIKIGNNVIMGWRSTVMPGVEITDNTVIGANATVTKSLTKSGVYAGSPAKFMRFIIKPTQEEKVALADKIIEDFRALMKYYDVHYYTHLGYPEVWINNIKFNLEDLSYEGEHDDTTDAFRDFLRRYGIRIFAPHGFSFNLKRK